MNIFKKILFWLYLKLHSIITRISIALYVTEVEILKADANDLQEKDKKIQRMVSRNKLLEKFHAGQTDEKYVKDYYEVLKKADNFVKTATPHKMAVAADKQGSNFGLADIYGRKHEHLGWFDDKHKHTGKTLAEVIEFEMEERRSKDDNFKLLYIFNNNPVEVGLSKIFNVVQEIQPEPEVQNIENDVILEVQEIEVDSDDDPFNTKEMNIKYEVKDIQQKSKTFEFPIRVQRENEDVLNKIEQLADSLHVKEFGLDNVLLEFFIPLKYKTEKIEDNSEIYEELTKINSIFVKNNYGEWFSFGVNSFQKRFIHNNTHEVWKFEGFIMKNLGTY